MGGNLEGKTEICVFCFFFFFYMDLFVTVSRLFSDENENRLVLDL